MAVEVEVLVIERLRQHRGFARQVLIREISPPGRYGSVPEELAQRGNRAPFGHDDFLDCRQAGRLERGGPKVQGPGVVQPQGLDPGQLETGRDSVLSDGLRCRQPAAREDLGQDELAEVNDLVSQRDALRPGLFEGGANDGIRNTGASTYTVYSGLTLIGSGGNSGSAFVPDAYDRFVGNTFMCPSCDGQSAAMTGTTGNIALGNVVTKVSSDTTVLPNGSDKEYHAVYFGGNNFEFGWNRIYNTAAYNGFQINEDGSTGFYNFAIHDNDIADVNGSGVNLSDIDPSSGYVQVYNNIIHHTGLSVASDGGEGDPHSCIAVKGYGSATAPGTAEIYNNTMFDCSSYLKVNTNSRASCAVLLYANQLNVTTNLVNNIVYQPAYAGTETQNVYICGGGAIGTLSGSNNLWYSERVPHSVAPVTQYGMIANPRFISTTDYHLQNGSPAIGAGIAITGLTRDFDGALRSNPLAIGAYEYSKSDSAARPSPSGAGFAVTPNTIAPFATHKNIVFLSIFLVSIIVICIGRRSQQL